jgi:hypothetical protein
MAVEKTTAIEKRWQQILAAALDGAVVEPGGGEVRPDLLIRTRDGQSIAVEVKWAGEGWPQDVRRAAANVAEHWPADVVLLAHRLSPGAIDWLRDRGANWADEAGQARILGPDGLIVIREPAQLPREERTSRRFTWSPSALVIAEAILAGEDQPLRATELAHRAGWSVPQVANVLKAFDAQSWTVKRGSERGPSAHRQLVNVEGMLAAWSAASADSRRATRIAHRATRDVMALLRDELAPALDPTTNWAVSGWGGLELVAPFATTTPSLHIYVADSDFAGPLSSAIEAAGLREVDEGGRVTFWAADPRVLKFATRGDDVPVASPPRLYADLSSFGARGQDAADHVKEQLIDPLHHTTPGDHDRTDG